MNVKWPQGLMFPMHLPLMLVLSGDGWGLLDMGSCERKQITKSKSVKGIVQFCFFDRLTSRAPATVDWLLCTVSPAEIDWKPLKL